MMDGDEILPIVYACFPSFAPMLLIFIICNFGHYLTQRFKNVEDEFFAIHWYMLPLTMQRNWPIVAAVAQNEIGLQVFGSRYFNRLLFMQVQLNNTQWSKL